MSKPPNLHDLVEQEFDLYDAPLELPELISFLQQQLAIYTALGYQDLILFHDEYKLLIKGKRPPNAQEIQERERLIKAHAIEEEAARRKRYKQYKELEKEFKGKILKP